MAETVISSPRLIQATRKLITEFVRPSRFYDFTGPSPQSVIYSIDKSGRNDGGSVAVMYRAMTEDRPRSAGPLAGNETPMALTTCQMWMDVVRFAHTARKFQVMDDFAGAFETMLPSLQDMMSNYQDRAIMEAYMALPSGTEPFGRGGEFSNPINGILYHQATAAQRDAWNVANRDRISYGGRPDAFNNTHATALANVAATDTLTTAGLDQLLLLAKLSRPRITPVRYENFQGRSFYTLFCGARNFAQVRASLVPIDRYALGADGYGTRKGYLYKSGDAEYIGMTIVEMPEIDELVDRRWTSLKTAGASGIRVQPVFLCGSSSMAMPIYETPRPTKDGSTDYDEYMKVGIRAAFGIGKPYHREGDELRQVGVVTGFFAAP